MKFISSGILYIMKYFIAYRNVIQEDTTQKSKTLPESLSTQQDATELIYFLLDGLICFDTIYSIYESNDSIRRVRNFCNLDTVVDGCRFLLT